MTIPKRIKVGRKWYAIKQVKHAGKRIMGEIDYDKNTIKIGKESAALGTKYKTEEIYDTFWHEMTHAILHDMKSKLDDDEEFVISFSNRLNKAILSAEF